MLDKGIKLSEELKTIFDNASYMATKGKYKEISIEMVVYLVVKCYLNNSGNDSLYMKDIISGMTPSDRTTLERLCYQEACKTKKSFTLPNEYLNTSDITVSDSLGDLLLKIRDVKKLSKAILDKEIKVPELDGTIELITSDDFIGSILMTEKYKDLPIVLILENSGLTKSSYEKHSITSFSEMFNSSEEFDTDFLEWKDKILSNPIMMKENLNFDAEDEDDDDEDFEDDEEEGEEEEETREEEEPKENNNPEPDIIADDNEFERAGQVRDAINVNPVDPNSQTPELDKYAIDMTKNAREGKYDPVVGRTKEIDEICEVLCCRKKNNAILLGDPGTGKTAIIELLASKISSGDVPRDLRNKRIFSLDLNALVAGCIYRGQYEERLQGIIREVIGNKDIIIFIDEIHNLLGNGSSSGQGDGANILKPYLARGEFQCLGSTTTDEYRKIIEKDGALKRRFQSIFIEEPNEEDTTKILLGLSDEYSKFHKVKYSDAIISKCVEWSGKYINDRFFPDKAIGILDMSSSLAKLTHPVDFDPKLEELGKKKLDLENKINELVTTSNGDPDMLESAGTLMAEAEAVENELNNLEESIKTNSDYWTEVTVDDVSNVISKLSGVPIDKIMSSDMTKIKEMKTELERRVIGQDKAIDELTIALQRNILGIRDPKKPIASFLLVGSTGTGKTLISKVLAQEFFGSEKSLVSISCSEYMQDWAESKLLGSAPGYVGYSDTEPRLYVLKRRPYTVLLIDEIEKSSKNLYNIWLNMLEEGEVTLSTGEKISCKNAIIIFTGNVGTKSLELKGNGLGFGKSSESDLRKMKEETVMNEVRKEFRPEFLNRLSKIIIFNPLGKEELMKIFDLEFDKLRIRYKESNGYDLSVSEAVKEFIVSKCDPKYGARSLNRLLVEHIDQNVCRALLDSSIDSEGKTFISLDKEKDCDEIKVTFAEK